MALEKKELYLAEFSKTMKPGELQYLSFYNNKSVLEEFEIFFEKLMQNYGKKHTGIYRMCDAEYMYCVGRKAPLQGMSLKDRIRFAVKTWLVNRGFVNQKTGHFNLINKEIWFGEHYTNTERKKQNTKFLEDMRKIANEGYLAPHLVYSKSHFAEEYIQPMLKYFEKNNIPLTKDTYFPFYFVYVMLSMERYKSRLYKGKDVLIVTAFNERNKQENFKANLAKEGVNSVHFYNISHDKSMLDVIDKSKLPAHVDLVLIGAGIGSANIINQLTHLNALCIDSGHALDCISRPQLRIERVCLLPDEDFNKYPVTT